jgi:hypothetical protein
MGSAPARPGIGDARRDADGRAADGRFATFATSRVTPEGAWSALNCDTHAIVEILARFGRADDPRAAAAFDRMASDLVETAQGRAWPCVPWGGFRGPGRKGDLCPQVTLEALRAFAMLAPERRPAGLDEVLRTAVGPWLRRGDEQPYMFGHGYGFKTVKWPGFWYDVLRTVETLGRYPALLAWEPGRRALAELAACLVAYNVDPDGTVTPRRCSRGFEAHSFGGRRLRDGPGGEKLRLLRRRDDAGRRAALTSKGRPGRRSRREAGRSRPTVGSAPASGPERRSARSAISPDARLAVRATGVPGRTTRAAR